MQVSSLKLPLVTCRFLFVHDTSPTSFFSGLIALSDETASCYGPLLCDMDAITFFMHSGEPEDRKEYL